LITSLIITYHNQLDNWSNILKGISNQLTMPDYVFLIADRVSDSDMLDINSINAECDFSDIIRVIPIHHDPIYVGRPSKQSFHCAHIRNIGTDEALKVDSDVICYIDGDCVPQRSLISSHIDVCTKNIPIITSGRKRERKYGWKDRRETLSNLHRLDIFREGGVIFNSPDLFTSQYVINGSNFAINTKAIKLIKRFNLKYYSRDELFNSLFNGDWGGEDGFLAITAYQCRVIIATISNKSSGVEHVDHPEPSDDTKKRSDEFFKDQLDKMRKALTIRPISISLFE
jgi:hypothetical protein